MRALGDLEFKVEEVYPIESEGSRARVVVQGDAAVSIDYSIPSASYGVGTRQILIETEYAIRITPAPSSSISQEDVIAYLRYRVLVALSASRELTPEDADSGALDEATMEANYAAHPYHRQGISSMVAALGLPPYPLPVTFDAIRASLEEETRVAAK